MLAARRVAICVVVLALVAAAAAAAAAAPAAARPAPTTSRTVGTVELRPCNVLPGAWCGSIERPWEEAGTVPGTVRVGFAWLPASSGRSVATLVPHEGGPGYSTTGSARWFADMYGDLLRDHDLLLVDQRGTGRTAAIACEPLDTGALPYIRAIGLCGRSLGQRAWSYGTEASADDLAAVLDALEIDMIDMYGDSYGTFFGQVFAGRHGDRLRTLVLDGTYPTFGETAWYPTQAPALRRSLTAVCARSQFCADAEGEPVPLLRALLARVRADPMAVRAPGGDGRWHDVVVDPAAVVAVAFNATYVPATYREFTAAVRAALGGDARPLGRLYAEYLWSGEGGVNPREYSEGAAAAVSCHDYPQLFDLRRSVDRRSAQLRDALRRKEVVRPGLYAPFTIEEYKRSGWGSFGMCREWPQPQPDSAFGPPRPPSDRYPAVPTLVLSGEFDTITTADEGGMVAARFPRSRHIVVANGLHVVAGTRPDACATRLVHHVIRTGDIRIPAGLSACASDSPPIRAVGTYPRLLVDVALPEDSSDDTATQIAVASAGTVADVIDRWWQSYSSDGLGLRGGTWSYRGEARVRFALTDVRLVRDLPVSGVFTWNRITGRVNVDLRVPASSGVHTLVGSWNAEDPGAVATLRMSGPDGSEYVRIPAP